MRVVPVHRGDVERRRQVLDHGVQQRLHALVLERGAAEDRCDPDLDRGRADRVADLVVRELVALQVLLDKLVVVFDGGLDELLPELLDQLLVRGGDRVRRELGAQ